MKRHPAGETVTMLVKRLEIGIYLAKSLQRPAVYKDLSTI